jgi:3-hydroxymyristoyl/3-hydroxydecanoyl-(acyl carrier protein) dehydratase
VALHPDGAFSHLGRLDDVVKVASRRVSLGAVERALLGAPGVVDAAVALVERGGRERLHALVVLDGDEVAVRRWLAERLDAVAVPRLHRVARLPREATGKLPQRTLLAAIDAALGVAPTEARSSHEIAADHPGFAGHFPGQPVLPAVVQLLDLVLPEVAATWPELGSVRELRRLKFLRPVLPGDTVDLVLVREAAAIRFTISARDEVAASGALRVDGLPTAPR